MIVLHCIIFFLDNFRSYIIIFFTNTKFNNNYNNIYTSQFNFTSETQRGWNNIHKSYLEKRILFK